MRTTKNYTEDGGNKTVIGGELQILTDGKITNSAGDEVNLAQQVALQADSAAADVAGVVADLNALIAKLKTAGVMASE